MYQVSSEQHRKIVSAIVRSAIRPPKSMRSLDWPRFLQAYYANVDAEDVAEREPAEEKVRLGKGIQPNHARARVHLAPHHHRDGERRHAVSRRFDQPRVDA